jgi:hypothetical protein
MFGSNTDEASEKEKEPVDLEEEKKKRKTYLKYNRAKNGIFGDKNEPELIEKES